MADLFVVSAPSGAGKTTLISALIQSFNHIKLSISHTTRHKRPNETDGTDYHFVTQGEFDELIKHDALLEYAQVFNHCYGTHQDNVKAALMNHYDVVLEIDWQGYRQIKQRFQGAISIFILPPSLQTLEERLIERGQDDTDTIKNRMTAARNQIEHYDEYDYLIINRDFNVALSELKSIVLSRRLRLKNQCFKEQSLIDSLL